MITVYEADARDFTTLGIGIADAARCEIEEIAGGMYECTLEMYARGDGRHLSVRPGRILRVPALVRESPEITLAEGSARTVQRQIWRCVTQGRLYVRESPNGRKLASLCPGDEVMKLGEDASTGSVWFHVALVKGGMTGWVFPNTAGTAYLEYVCTRTVTVGTDDARNAVTADSGRTQLFRVDTVECVSERRLVRVRARHISYDLAGVIWRGSAAGYDIPLETLCARLRDTAYVSHDAGIRVISRVNGANWRVERTVAGHSAAAILLNAQDGALRQAGARLVRDNFNVWLLPRSDRAFARTIRYGKDLLTATYRQDATAAVTRILPLGKTANGEALWGTMQDSSRIAELGVRAAVRQYAVTAASENAADVAAAKTRLNTMAAREFSSGGADAVRVELEAETLPTAGMHLYDRVRVVDAQMGLDRSTVMTGYRYDALAGRYISLTLSEENE